MADWPGRPLGFMESCMAGLEQAVPGSMQLVAAAQLHGPLDECAAAEAFRLLQHRHPLLRARFELGDEWRLECTGDTTEPPVELARFGDGAGWEDVFQRQCQTPLPSSGPLWRALLLGDGTASSFLFLTINHAITDGLSQAALVRQFVSAHNRLVAGGHPDVRPLPLRPPVERLLEHARSVRSETAPLPETARWRREMVVPAAERRPRHICRTLAPSTVRQLRDRARREGTTVNGALVSALIAAGPSVPTCDAVTSCLIPTNIRGLINPPIPSEEMGIYFRDVRLLLDVEDVRMGFWKRARRCTEMHRAGLDAALAAPEGFSIDDIAAGVESFTHSTDDAFTLGYGAVSNMGRLEPDPAAGPLRLGSFRIGQGAISGALATSLVVATIDDCMYLTFTSTAPLLSDESALRVVESVLQEIEAAAA